MSVSWGPCVKSISKTVVHTVDGDPIVGGDITLVGHDQDRIES